MNFSSNRWVLLHHQVGDQLGDRGDHFDLMLSPEGELLGAAASEEANPDDVRCLLTWAIPINPMGQLLLLECSAERLPDHRAAYLEYEGPVSGDRGHVQRVASGSYEVVVWSEQRIELRVECNATPVAGHDGPFSVLLVRRAEDWRLSWCAFL